MEDVPFGLRVGWIAPPLDRKGFSLVEALVAMLLSSVVVALVASVFLVQNSFYSDVVSRSSLNESVRSAVSHAASELRGVSAGGVVVAESEQVVFRVPLVLGGVCDVSGSSVFLLLPLGGRGLDPSQVSGYAVKDSTGAWGYRGASWSSLYVSSGGGAAAACALAGADTVGAREDFHHLAGLAAPTPLQTGDVVMIYREMEYRIGPSALNPSSMALFRGLHGDTLAELATNLSPESAFEYRLTGETSFRDRVTGTSNLRDVNVVRLRARGIAPATTATRDSLTLDLTTTIFLRNAR